MNLIEGHRGGTEKASGDMELIPKVFPEKPSDDPRDIPCVRFTADQVIEITADDYSLKVFNLTRIKALTISEIVSMEPEPEPGDARDAIERFLDVDLIIEVAKGQFYSKYPENYVNFTDHPYDEELESDKDARVFKLMKNKAGDKEFWSKNAYFSEDGYFTQEQTMEIKKRLQDIKFFIKKVIQENNKKGNLEGLKFRRHKFYDLTLPILAVMILLFSIVPHPAFAGNDPGGSRGAKWTIDPLTTQELAASIDWSKATFWQDYVVNNIVVESNDPGRHFIVPNDSFYKANDPGIGTNTDFANFIKNGNVVKFTQQPKCEIQLQATGGDMKAMSVPCLGDVKFATDSVCGVYGDAAYCDVAARAGDLLKQYKVE